MSGIGGSDRSDGSDGTNGSDEFELSCERRVGALLAALAAAVPPNGRIAELGTGAGVGLAWITHGLGDRADVEVVSVELDDTLREAVAAHPWPAHVRLVGGDGAEQVAARAPFDLVFADAPGGKLDGLEHTIAALAPGGILVVDDMDPAGHDDDELVRVLARVRDDLVADPRLVASELDASSGVILATRRRSPSAPTGHGSTPWEGW